MNRWSSYCCWCMMLVLYYMYYIDEMMIMMMTKTFVTRSSPVQGEVAQHCIFILTPSLAKVTMNSSILHFFKDTHQKWNYYLNQNAAPFHIFIENNSTTITLNFPSLNFQVLILLSLTVLFRSSSLIPKLSLRGQPGKPIAPKSLGEVPVPPALRPIRHYHQIKLQM